MFSVIYEFDIPRDDSVRDLLPRNRRLWKMTEQGGTEYGEIYPGGKHRKLCAFLTRQQFERWLGSTSLIAERYETMGSIGAPGFGFGWAPAISFRWDYDPEVIAIAYVTPCLCNRKGEPIRKGGATERDWQRVRKVVIERYS